MTAFGINPSFCGWTSRLPLFADPIRRGKTFEVFKEDGTPTGEPSPLGPDGWPVVDGRWHGVRLFGDMDGFMSEISVPLGSSVKLRINPGKSAFAYWKGGQPDPLSRLKPAFGDWHLPSGEALRYFKPQVLRTLDWSYQARKEKRPDWSKRRVLPTDPLQGEEMALELQCKAANLLNCHLWWNAPPRFEMSVADYSGRMAEYLEVLRDNCKKPPILEYGNELWNSGFPAHDWLRSRTAPVHTWHEVAGDEISDLRQIAAAVFGPSGALGQAPYFLFVGGCLADGGFALDRILSRMQGQGVMPDCAGPAFYVTPLKADKDRWSMTGEIPTQDQLKESMLGNIPNLRTKLDAHRSVLKSHGVPYFCVYEAGQSLIANGKPWKKAAIEAQKTEWMGGIYREIRAQLNAAKVDVACFYSAASSQSPEDSRVDVFGLLEATLDKAQPLPKAIAARGD